ncbi:Secretion protein HlyD family protein [Syntrophobacter sp. SbD1]|nr:Secretion protein HlyD family protein [Syntrophobacter sp. SbD1]
MSSGKDIPTGEGPAESDRANNKSRTLRIKAGGSVLLVLVIAASIYWLVFKRNYVSTDDAYARADSAMVSARVPGTVLKVLVDNDFAVSTGQPLIELDPADYKIAVDKAKAVLDGDEAELKAAETMVPPVNIQTSSQVDAAEAALKAAQDAERQTGHNIQQLKDTRAATAADLAQAERDSKRFETLSVSGAGTQRQHEQAETAFDKAKAQLKAVDAQIAALESALSGASQQVTRARAQLQTAISGQANVYVQARKVEALQAKRDKSRAELEAARLNLSYCVIAGPIEGYIAQKNIQVGDRVQPGQAMMAVVPLSTVYVEANFKETQLTNVRIGQPASILADIYPGYTYQGKVAGIRAGTGAAFSLIPPENATGNWIKIVQRIPVRIELDQPPPPDHPLRVGASLDVTINVADRSGPNLLQTTRITTLSNSSEKP